MQRTFAAGSWVVGPPSSWSSRDQEAPDVTFLLSIRTSPRRSRHQNPLGAVSYTSHHPGKPTIAAGELRFGGEMLLNIGLVLLLAWAIGVLGVYDIGQVVHAFLLGGLMLLLLGFVKARETTTARAPGARDSSSHR